DPLSDKARALNDEIAALEAEIKKLDAQLARTPSPRFRSTATPQGVSISHTPDKPKPAPPAPVHAETIFEPIKRGPLTAGPEVEAPEIYNELGVRRYDLPALWNRLRNYFHGPATSNPRLVNYLAAGGVHGLLPLRKEKRVARMRVLFLAVLFLAMLLGILWIYAREHH
ncbi:MAG TPA: hypothetical protein VL970_11985, partial [Candidatus Acidoferrales bacterium]|nr:hypothetical protein [Candidatus Acidoferrales bacterium]